MIKFGIVGAGAIAEKFAQDIKLTNNSECVAVASRNLEKAKTFQEKYSIEFAYGSYQEMAEDNAIDAVYIATPHNFHKEQSIMFMDAGKAVICEKPIAVNAIEFDEMVKAAKRNNVLLMEAMWTRFLPASKRLKNIVESKEFGEVTNYNFEFGFSLMENADQSRRLLNPNLAGGSLLDVGIYPVSYLKYLNNTEIASISSQAKFHEIGVDKSTETEITFRNGVMANLKSSLDDWLSNQAVITFERGEVIVPNFWSASSILVNGSLEEYPHRAGGFEYQIESFSDTLLENLKENQIMTYKESRDVMVLMDQIREIIGLKYPFE